MCIPSCILIGYNYNERMKNSENEPYNFIDFPVISDDHFKDPHILSKYPFVRMDSRLIVYCHGNADFPQAWRRYGPTRTIPIITSQISLKMRDDTVPKQKGTARRIESRQQSFATLKNQDVGRGLQKIVACSQSF